ncbi:hypothetical protein [Kitasatospora camelliae]|uniref:Uncharacterized protein n=1 Tax=Kitasatospora camelliae TaxID=3156397 RepID=A0AAU8JNU0_9ACTN
MAGSVRDVVVDVVTQLAPEELPLLRGLDGMPAEKVVELFGRRRRGEPLGFGLAEAAALVTPVVWMAVDEACRAAVGAGVERAGRGFRRLWRRGGGRGHARPAVEPPVPPLDARQLAAVHARVHAGAREAGLDESAAGALADCVVARLATDPSPTTTPATPNPPATPARTTDPAPEPDTAQGGAPSA